MMTIREARCRRTVDRGGKKHAEVEVEVDSARDSSLLAYFRVGEDGSYELGDVLENDAKTAVDWFDNNLHSALSDPTPRLFSGPDHLGLTERGVFAAQVLEAPGIREALDRSLKNH